MIVGVPREIKRDEYRVAMLPVGVEELRRRGHHVLVERGAGQGSGIADEEYAAQGAELVDTAEEVFQRADLIVKVKEPQESEWPLLRRGQTVFTYFHFAADRRLTEAILNSGCTAVAYETLRDERGRLPLLTPMSEVAGRMSVQIGARLLESFNGGRGVLLGGVPGVPPGEVVIIGGGIVGTNAAKMALGLGANVTIIERSADRMRYLDDVFRGQIRTVMSNAYNIASAAAQADLLIGAVLIPGARAPRLVTEEMVRNMKKGSVIVDVAVDQGGSIETIDRVTTHSDPTYVKHGVIHYAVANIPGAVPRTSTFALTNATLPYALELADKGLEGAVRDHEPLKHGVNTYRGHVTHRAVAESLGLEYTPLELLLSDPGRPIRYEELENHQA